jgi:hypothetical protein
MNLFRNILSLALMCSFNQLKAQNDSLQKTEFELRAFVDAYYGFDFDKPENGFRQLFLYNHDRHNQFNINLAFLQMNMDHGRFRARLGIQGGTYVNDNYNSEPGALKYFSEASVGVKLLKKKALWLDAGIFPSHIGFETAISSDNLNLTRSFVAESSPYYLAGAKLNYAFNKKWELELIACNGWQRIQPVPGNSLISLGSRLTYTANKFKLNWSTFVGTDSPDAYRTMRYFSNLYSKHQIGKKLELILNWDQGAEQKWKGSEDYNFWTGLAGVFRYSFTDQLKLGGRAEFYQDLDRVIMGGYAFQGFKTAGYSLNLDYFLASGVQLRLEGRLMDFRNPIYTIPAFTEKTGLNAFVCASLSVDLRHKFK